MLTVAAIKAAKTPKKPVKLFDGQGLYLLLTPAGGRLWRLKYRFAGKEKLLALGAYDDVSLRDARLACGDAKRKLAGGIDPAAVRRQGENTFEALAREWLEHVRPERKAITVHDMEKRFGRYVFSKIGHMAVDDIAVPDVMNVLRRIEARGRIITAHKTAGDCRQVFSYAIACGRGTRNPVMELRGALRARPKAKPMAAVSEAELPALLSDIDGYHGSKQTRLALRLMALTFVRTTELRGARWDEIRLDPVAGWNIPAERMKMARPHHVPLSRQAVAVLRELQTMNGDGPLVFPGERDPRKPMSKGTITEALKRMEYRGRMTGHGFRAVASTILNEHGHFRREVIDWQLAHAKKDKVEGAYNRALYLKERITMMTWWGDYLDRLRTDRDSKIVALPSEPSRTPLPSAAEQV